MAVPGIGALPGRGVGVEPQLGDPIGDGTTERAQDERGPVGSRLCSELAQCNIAYPGRHLGVDTPDPWQQSRNDPAPDDHIGASDHDQAIGGHAHLPQCRGVQPSAYIEIRKTSLRCVGKQQGQTQPGEPAPGNTGEAGDLTGFERDHPQGGYDICPDLVEAGVL